MALARSKQATVGSTRWVQEEKDHASTAISSEVADFGFSVRNEMEWLNEKMADVFSRDPKTLTDVLKTPGKLRGRTPRTVRKDAATPRQPLADIFAPNARIATPSGLPKPDLVSQAPTFKISEDLENQQPHTKPTSRSRSPQRIGKPGNTDSGYHGMTEDEMDTDTQSLRTTASRNVSQQDSVPQERAQTTLDETNPSGDESFESAPEDLATRQTAKLAAQAVDAIDYAPSDDAHAVMAVSGPEQPADEAELEATEVDVIDDIPDDTEIVKHSQRKSSFNFSSLPAREPLLAKRSIGGRNSYLETNLRTSVLPKAARTASGASAADDRPEPETATKSTAQRLHERITLLGKTRDQRTSTLPGTSQEISYPTLPQQASADVAQVGPGSRATRAALDDHDEEAPAGTEIAKYHPAHYKHMSVPDIQAAVRSQDSVISHAPKAASLYNVAASFDSGSSTPQHPSSIKKPNDGPLSASKSRLMSVLKSARSIFASSASASAAAKLEAHDTSPTRGSPTRDASNGSSTSAAVMQMPGALYSHTSLASSRQPISNASSERRRKQEEELRSQLKAESDLEKAREKEKQKVAKERKEQRSGAGIDSEPAHLEANTSAKAHPPVAGKLKPVAKPVRPAKETAVPRPAPVNVKVGSQLQALQEPHSRPGSSMRPSSAHSTIKSAIAAPTNSRLRALEAAARKKELEDREKQRKAQQKKDLERKRAAKVEEEQRLEAERKAEEQRRAQESRLASSKLAEKRAADAKRQQQVRDEQQRIEQQRHAAQKREEDALRAKAAHELAEAIQRERAQQQAHALPRSEITGTLRQLTAKAPADSGVRPPVNPAKPPKRVHDADDHGMQRSVPEQGTTSYQQNEGKRRKTDEKPDVNQRVSVMAPPKRPSTMRKETLTRFPHGYANAQAPPTHQPSGMFKAVVNNQHQMQQSQRAVPTHPNQTIQMSTARIAFAENAGPPTTLPSGYPTAENSAHGQNKFKTPVRPAQVPASAAKSAKSSPMFTHGDAIALPEIATDSEEEEDDEEENTGFRAPSWVASPALRELLTQQQLVDPESVFGPIGELKMEEVFRGAKNAERLKKFRDRGSSAAWIQNGDAVTSAEKRRDMQMRERVAREGGWRYEPGL